MDISSITTITLLLLLWGAQFKKRSLLRSRPITVSLVAIGCVATTALIQTQQYFAALLASPPPARYLIPPYADLSYFLFSAQRRFWIHYLIALLVAMLIFALIQAIPAKRRKRIFEREEPFILALGIFLVAHPFWIFYILITLALYIALLVAATFQAQKSIRSSFYYLWMPAAILTIAITPLLKTHPALHALILFN